MSNDEATKKIINRLKTIKGHVAGIEKMVEEDKPCDQILIQIAAIKSSINKVGLAIMEKNADACLFSADNEGKVNRDDVKDVIKMFINFSK